MRRLGFDLVRRHYYSPIPDLAELPPDTWTRKSDLRALEFDVAAGREFFSRELAPYIAEYTPPHAPTGNPRDFYLDNRLYERVDAEILYAMVRRFSPRRVIELGSGMSTLVMADALARSDQREETSHVVYDPYPRDDLITTLQQVAELRSVSATHIPLAEFDRLESSDILFIDTSHTVKIGSDVNRIILDVLPTLAPGVLVQLHDIYLPWEYPRELRVFWGEQYLLQAFLAFNPEFEILLPAHALQRQFPDDVARLVPSARPETNPSAFWLRRVEHQVPE